MTTFTQYVADQQGKKDNFVEDDQLVDGVIKQNEFVKLYKNWLSEYVYDQQVFQAESLSGSLTSLFEEGNGWSDYFDIDINQNGKYVYDEESEKEVWVPNGTPTLVFKDGINDEQRALLEEELTALNESLVELFGEASPLEVVTGNTSQTRSYFDSFSSVEQEPDPWGDNPFIIAFDDDGNPLLVDAEGNETSVYQTDQDGRYVMVGEDKVYIDGADGANGTGRDGSTRATNGEPGEDGENLIVVDKPEDPYTAILIRSEAEQEQINYLIGGEGGDGGDGVDGVSANNHRDGTDGGDGGDGGYAIVNGDLKDVYIIGDKDLTLLGGSRGEAGSSGDGHEPTGQGQGNEPGEDGVDGDLGQTAPAFSDAVNVDATRFTGHLTISGSDDDDTFVLGDGGSDLHATRGEDEYTLGDGQDIIRYTSLARNDDGSFDTDTLIGFDVSEDQIDITALEKVENWKWSFDQETNRLNIDLDYDGIDDLSIELVGVDSNSISENIFIA